VGIIKAKNREVLIPRFENYQYYQRINEHDDDDDQ